jgi:poly(3-hydroxybutyrate) depolymerase
MIYHLYQANMDLLDPIRQVAKSTSQFMRKPWPGTEHNFTAKVVASALELISDTGTTHRRPSFEIDTIRVGNRLVEVREEAAFVTPFGTLLHFAKDSTVRQPKILLVAPMSGHFATLLRGTVKVLLQDHDVYVTDWHNARDVPLKDGVFGFDDYTDHVIRFLEVLGPGSHVIAVCQPAVAVLAAVSIMAQSNNRAQPRSMTLMAGPIDTRLSPTKVNKLAKEHSIDWFEKNLIGSVPFRYRGARRRVYPGFMQLTAFVSMNLDRHVRAHLDQFKNLVKGDGDSVTMHRKFYNEYLAVMDLPAEFFLQTVKKVFQDHDLPRGMLTFRHRPVEPAAIRRTALFTVEGELDDICAIGQTMAALDLCKNLRPSMKRHHLQTGVGHYGVFNGKRWANEIYPQVREFGGGGSV